MPTCGGAIPAGVYTYSDACADDPLVAARSTCPGPTADGGNLLRGQIVFDGCGFMRRQVALSLNGTVDLTGVCAFGCNTVQTNVRLYVPTATCALTGNACRCTIDYAPTVNEAGPYSLDAGVLTFFGRPDGGARRFHYCVSGSTLTMRELDVTPTELGTSRLVR